MNRSVWLAIAALGVVAAAACDDGEQTTTPTTTNTTSGAGGTGQGGSGGTDTPGLPSGSACSDSAECESGFCLSEQLSGWPTGYCSDACNEFVPCPGTDICVDLGGNQFCLTSCSAASDCRDAYDCYDLGDGTAVCGPYCTDDSQCTAPNYCNQDTGVCAQPEVCDDGQDNEGDDLIDCEDDECATECDPMITSACSGATTAQANNSGNTASGTAMFWASCTGAMGAKENVYTYTAASDGEIVISLDSATDQGIYVRTDCADAFSELGCADAYEGGQPETLAVGVTAGQPVFIFVDGYFDPAEAGPYTLKVTFQKQICGDGLVTAPEECDDGGTVAGDGCNATCMFEVQNETEPNDDAQTATMISPGKVEATIATPGDMDWFKVSVPGPTSTLSVYTMGSLGEICGPDGLVDTEIEIYGTDGTTSLASNEDINGSSNWCSAAEATGLAAGTYYVRVAASQTYCQDCAFPYGVVILVN